MFEHLKSEFKPHKLDRQFTARNKKIRRHLKKRKDGMDDEIDALKTKMSKDTLTKNMKYKKKFASGKIIGLQNLIPGFEEKTEIVFYTENSMIAEIHEVDVESLRDVLNEDKDIVE